MLFSTVAFFIAHWAKLRTQNRGQLGKCVPVFFDWSRHVLKFKSNCLPGCHVYAADGGYWQSWHYGYGQPVWILSMYTSMWLKHWPLFYTDECPKAQMTMFVPMKPTHPAQTGIRPAPPTPLLNTLIMKSPSAFNDLTIIIITKRTHYAKPTFPP